MDYFPLFLALRDKPCLLVGDSERALPKLSALLDAGARVTLAGKTPHDSLVRRITQAGGTVVATGFNETLLDQCWFVIAASDNAELNQIVANAANARRVWVNVADTPSLCSAILPAIIDRSPLLIAISSSGATPMLATWLRQNLERQYPTAWQELAIRAAELRPKVNQYIPMGPERRQFWHDLFDSAAIEALLAGDQKKIDSWVEQRLGQPSGTAVTDCRLYLIPPPAAPDLLSLRAWRWLSQADSVLYQTGTDPAMLAYARREVRLIELADNEPDIMTQLHNCHTASETAVCLHSNPALLARLGEQAGLTIITAP